MSFLFSMISDLHEACEKLERDAGARKVLLCDPDGEVLAHAGQTGVLDEATGEAVAALAGDLIAAGEAAPAETVVTLPRALTACAAP
ncbi:MAG TPA: roadblock/LC7 domain-containing protein, partial [Polyangia bacterium]